MDPVLPRGLEAGISPSSPRGTLAAPGGTDSGGGHPQPPCPPPLWGLSGGERWEEDRHRRASPSWAEETGLSSPTPTPGPPAPRPSSGPPRLTNAGFMEYEACEWKVLRPKGGHYSAKEASST